MECPNHPGVTAADRCVGCAEAFCNNCLVPMGGQKYCASCKVLALRGRDPSAVPAPEPTVPCKEAGEALTYAIVGLFCLGIILEPIAITKAVQAKKLIAADPTLAGSGKATAALIIGVAALGLWVLGIIGKITSI